MLPKVELTIALPAELAERIDKFVAETGKDREQVALGLLELALFYAITPSERAEEEAAFKDMATDEDYQKIVLQLLGEFGG